MGSRAALAAAALLAAAVLPLTAQAPAFDPPPGVYGRTVVIAPPSVPNGDLWLYRFAAEDPWLRFDRPLELDAFSGEERDYSLMLKSEAEGASEIAVAYVIDRRAPLPPRLRPADGAVLADLSLGFSAEAGAKIFYLVSGSDEALEYDPSVPPRLHAAADGTRTVLISAWAQDQAGNSSPPAFASYILAPDGIPRPAPPPATVLPSFDRKTVRTLGVPTQTPGGEGHIRLTFPSPPAGASWIAAVEAPEPTVDLEGFVVWPPDAAPSFDVPISRGWKRNLRLRYGLLHGDLIEMAESALVLQSAVEIAAPAPAPPPPPSIRAAPDGSLVLSWPPTAGDIRVSIDGGPEKYWRSPRAILPRPGRNESEIAYRAISADGGSSPIRTLTLKFSVRPTRPLVRGAEQGGVYAESPKISAISDGVIRYAISADGAMPSEVGSSAAMLDRELSAPGLPGKTVQYFLRLRAFAEDGTFSDETLLSFVIDREPPPVPRLLDADQPGFSEIDRRIEFAAGDGTAMVSVSLAGASAAPFEAYSGPLTLSGSDDEPRLYRIRAYAIDEAGNRSPEMTPLAILIDRGSVYTASWGRDEGRGTPDSPLRSLAAAISSAAAKGKGTVRIGGDIPLGSPITVRGKFAIEGGYGRDWSTSTGRSRIDSGSLSGALIEMAEASLSLAGLEFVSDSSGSVTWLDLAGGSLDMREVRASISARGEALFIRARDADLSIDDCSLAFNRAVAARGLALVGGKAKIARLRLEAGPGVQDLGALGLAYTATSLEDLSLVSSAARNFSGISASGGRIEAARIDLRASGGSGTCAPFAFEGLDFLLESSYASVSWPIAFSMIRAEDSRGVLSHLTLRTESSEARPTMVELLRSEARIVNSILQNLGPLGLLFSSDRAPAVASIEANCLWGFSSLGEGALAPASLEILNARVTNAAAKNFLEKPDRTFVGTIKGRPVLSSGSACIDAALDGDASKGPDIDGDSRLSGRADIGADEYRK